MDDHDLVLKPIVIVSGILNFKKALLVGGTPTPLKHMNSVGVMTFRTEWTVIKHVPNHQPAYLYMALSPQNRCGLQSFQWMRINPMKTSQKKA